MTQLRVGCDASEPRAPAAETNSNDAQKRNHVLVNGARAIQTRTEWTKMQNGDVTTPTLGSLPSHTGSRREPSVLRDGPERARGERNGKKLKMDFVEIRGRVNIRSFKYE